MQLFLGSCAYLLLDGLNQRRKLREAPDELCPSQKDAEAEAGLATRHRRLRAEPRLPELWDIQEPER